MIHATRRGVRRSSLAGRQRRRSMTVEDIVKRAISEDRSVDIRGYPRGHRVATTIMHTPLSVTFGLRHPTKKANESRYCFVEVSKMTKRQQRAVEEAQKEAA